MIVDLSQEIEVIRERVSDGFGFVETSKTIESVYKTKFANIKELSRNELAKFGYSQEELIFNVKVRYQKDRLIQKGDLVKWDDETYVSITTAKKEQIGRIFYLTFLMDISNVQNQD